MGKILIIKGKYCALMLIVCMFFSVFPALAQTGFTQTFRLSCEPNSYDVDVAFADNALTMEELDKYLSELVADSTVTIRKITITASTSPDGSYEFNTRLSKQRLETIRQEILGIEGIEEAMIALDNRGIAWNDLKTLVSNSEEPYRDAVLNILDRQEMLVPYHSGLTIDQRVYDLMNLNGGRVWNHLKKIYFPQLRVMSVTNISYRKYYDLSVLNGIKPEPAIPEGALAYRISEPEHRQAELSEKVELWQPKVRFKTNGIGWAMFVGNGAVEFDLGRNWSLNLPVYYSDLDYFNRQTKFKTLTIQPEIRYWIGKKRNWYAGAHFGIGWYNYALSGEYRIQDCGWAHPALGGGLSGGYRMDLTKNGRWQMEFSLGAGVYATNYDMFINRPDGLIAGTVKKTWFGIDQAAVSVIYSLGMGKWRRR